MTDGPTWDANFSFSLGSDPTRTRQARRAARRTYAQEQFRPTPVASDFETAFAQRYYGYVEAGGSAAIDRFPQVLRHRRLAVWSIAGGVVTTILAVPITFAMAAEEPRLHWVQEMLAAWVASALLVLVPWAVAVAMSQRRLARQLRAMNEDREAYVARQRAQQAADADVERRLRDLGIVI